MMQQKAQLITAVEQHDIKAAQEILQSGVDINGRDWDGNTPLMIAAGAKGDKAMVQLLLDNGANVNAANHKLQTALWIATERCGKTDIASLLISKGANVNAVDSDGATPLINAIRSGDAQTAIALLNKGAHPNVMQKGWTPLLLAIRDKRKDIVQALIDKGADVSRLMERIYAVLVNDAGIMQALIDAGADFLQMEELHGSTFLMTAAENNAPATARLLIDLGVDVNAVTDTGWTALMYSAAHKSAGDAVMRLLIDNRVDTTLRNNKGETALEIAANKQRTDANALLDHKQIIQRNRSVTEKKQQHLKARAPKVVFR